MAESNTRAKPERQERSGFARWLLGPRAETRTQARERVAAQPRRPGTRAQGTSATMRSLGGGARVSQDPRPLFERAKREDAERANRGRATPRPRAQEQVQSWDTVERRELAPEEFDALSPRQQAAVRFNTDLLAAYDADQQSSPVERRNSRGLLSQLGLDDVTEKKANELLGLGVAPAVLYSDLFDSTGAVLKPNTTPEAVGGPQPGVVVRSADDRQRLVNSISAKLQQYLAGAEQKKSEEQLAAGLAAKDQFSFDNEQAKMDYEVSFDFVLDKTALQQMPWSVARESLVSAGYDPEDFKRYARERMRLMPGAVDRTSLQELDSWFGQE